VPVVARAGRRGVAADGPAASTSTAEVLLGSGAPAGASLLERVARRSDIEPSAAPQIRRRFAVAPPPAVAAARRLNGPAAGGRGPGRPGPGSPRPGRDGAIRRAVRDAAQELLQRNAAAADRAGLGSSPAPRVPSSSGGSAAAPPGYGGVIRRSSSAAADLPPEARLGGAAATLPSVPSPTPGSGAFAMPAFDRLHGAYGPGTVIRRTATLAERSLDAQPAPAAFERLEDMLTPELLDELVERVADRIEERVVMQLERRGQRVMPEVF
jgi:hypothetical protein